MIHLPALVGAPGAKGLDPASALSRAGLWAVQEAQKLARAGFEAVILENFGDIPFHKNRVGPETLASLAVIAGAVREAVKIPIGINVLRNDGHAALAIAAVTGCQFIRVNVLTGVVATDQGLIEGCAAELLRERDRLGADVRILADVHVKHARTLSSDDIGLAVEETALRGMADGVILTGTTTGRPVDAVELERAAQVARAHRIPLYIGSGAQPDRVEGLLSQAHGLIIGSALRRASQAGAPLDLKRVRQVIAAYRAVLRGARKSSSRKNTGAKIPMRSKTQRSRKKTR